MAEDWGRELFWDQLLGFIDDGLVIPVVGWDILTVRDGDREVSLSRLLAERLAAKLSVPTDDLPEGRELNAVACRHMEARGVLEHVYSYLKRVMPAAGEIEVPAPIRKLAEIDKFRLFVTTTFDPLLQWALDEVRYGGRAETHTVTYSPEFVKDLPEDFEDGNRATVFHLFGKLSSAPNYAVTDEDTLEFMHALQSTERRPNGLFHEFAKNQILFIGSRFPDWLTRFFVRTTASNRLSIASGQNFIADDSVRDDVSLRAFLASFSARTNVYEDGGPLQFVDELHRRWMETHAQDGGPDPPAAQPPARTDMELGAVFISYASDDLEAARRIKQTLEREARVTVWFDKVALEPGDDYHEKILDNIDRCCAFVPVISKQTTTGARRYFQREWKRAIDEAQEVPAATRFLLPIVIDETSNSDETVPREFRSVQWASAPGGECDATFVETIKDVYRDYQAANRVAR